MGLTYNCSNNTFSAGATLSYMYHSLWRRLTKVDRVFCNHINKVRLYFLHFSLTSNLTVSWSHHDHLHSGCQSTILGALIPGDYSVWPPAEVAPTIPNMKFILNWFICCADEILVSAFIFSSSAKWLPSSYRSQGWYLHLSKCLDIEWW